jgi:hypothetical protein
VNDPNSRRPDDDTATEVWRSVLLLAALVLLLVVAGYLFVSYL